MPEKECDVEGELREWFRGAGRVVVVGVGNPIRMDDFVGMKIVEDLKGKVDANRVMLIEAEAVPENHMQEIIDWKPTHILIIDAAKMGLKAGEAKLMNPEELTNYPSFSTHMLPLGIFCEYLVGALQAKIALLLIEPKMADFGEGLSSGLDCAADKLVTVLLKSLC